MDKLTCSASMTSDGWNFHRCGKPSKVWALRGNTWIPYCGIHSKRLIDKLPIETTEQGRADYAALIKGNKNG